MTERVWDLCVEKGEQQGKLLVVALEGISELDNKITNVAHLESVERRRDLLSASLGLSKFCWVRIKGHEHKGKRKKEVEDQTNSISAGELGEAAGPAAEGSGRRKKWLQALAETVDRLTLSL